MLKKLALLIALMYSVAGAEQTATLDPGQVYNTGNIINWGPSTNNNGVTPWINSVYQQSLTCWGPGGPGNCGPYPTVRPDQGAINFSYGMTDIHQLANIANALPNTSTGLRVNGYNFAFFAKNGNGWDNGQQDYLTAYVKFYDNKGSAVVDNQYNLNYQFNWTYFNFNKTFDTPYASKDLSTVQYGFVGMDSNFWAGTYGPEIYNISFNLKYSVDPCATNPMYSPTCPGYLDALNKLLPPTTIISDPILSTSISAGSTTTIVTDPVVSTVSITSTTSIGQPSVVSPIVSAPTSTTTASTSATQPTKESSGGSSNTSLALSIISKNSDRDAAGSAVAQAAVSQAQAAATQAQQEAASVAASAVANSTTMNAVTVGSQQSSGTGIKVNNNNNNNSTNFTLQSGITSVASMVSGPQISTNNTSTQQSSNSTGLSLMNNQPVTVSSIAPQQSAIVNEISYSLPLLQPMTQTTNIVAPIVFAPIEQQQSQQTTLQSTSITSQSIETYSIVPPNFLTDKANPLTDIVEGKNLVPQNNTASISGPSVNKNAGDNDVAGGVDINKMALAPAGYGAYLNLALRDADFYAPKEVYKNQRNVDNARALRSLASDRLHQEMVNQQYKSGN